MQGTARIFDSVVNDGLSESYMGRIISVPLKLGRD